MAKRDRPPRRGMRGEDRLDDGDRVAVIAAMYRRHDAQLHAVVRKRASANAAVVDDACAHAWLKLLSTAAVDVGPPRWSALAWVTTCAVRRAWEIERSARRVAATDLPALECAATAATGDRAAELPDVVLQHLRLQLVTQLPERPRRFMLRLALGYSYSEIAAAEGASYTTTNKQIAKAKRLLRALDSADRQGGETRPAAR
jgi:DNA-directed RNA polymerase specialized sigma24 family protein